MGEKCADGANDEIRREVAALRERVARLEESVNYLRVYISNELHSSIDRVERRVERLERRFDIYLKLFVGFFVTFLSLFLTIMLK